MTRGSLFILLVLSGCGGRVEPEYGGGAAAVSYAAECADEPNPPTKLVCTGLYGNMRTKTTADGVRAYTPAEPLWSDGAEKYRFILLPPGKKIDASDPNEWSFPIGTKVWKEFRVDGKRVETRLFQKGPDKLWDHRTYAWNKAESAAEISQGGDVPSPDGGVYHIPTKDECEQCHRGRTDRVLGFEAVSLGLDGAKGVTLDDLVSEHLISPVPKLTSLEVGDDGTGLAAKPLTWLHINCGVTCHNSNSGATAQGAKMRLRLDPEELDGRAPGAFESMMTTVGVTVNTPTWNGQTRIIPGDPSHSLLVELITKRISDGSDANNQMPPIASRVVDKEDTDEVIAWIMAMKPVANSGAPGAGNTPGSTASGTGGVR
jgi:hypothetical protein